MTEKRDFRWRIDRIESAVLHIMQEELPPATRYRSRDSIKKLVQIMKYNADVTAPEDIREVTEKYTTALNNIATLHLRRHFKPGQSPFNKLLNEAQREALTHRPTVRAYLDEHFPKETTQ